MNSLKIPKCATNQDSLLLATLQYTANVNRQTTDKLLFSYAIITGENV